MSIKTQEEIDELKRQWLRDPIWDIENTEGFEDHTDELKAFREKQEALWEEQHQLRIKAEAERIEQLAVALGIPGLIELARRIDLLEKTIDGLRNRLNSMDGEF